MAQQTPEQIEAAKAAAKIEAEAAEAAAAERARLAEEAKTLVKMTKPGQDTIAVHPTTVASHIGAGWKPVAE